MFRSMLKMPLAAVIMASWIVFPGATLAAEPVELKFASFTAPTNETNTIAIPKFIAAVEKEAEGTVKIKLYAGGTLGRSPAAQLKLVDDGIADIAQIVASYTPGRFPELSVFELPLMARNNLEGSLAAWHMYEKGLLSGFENYHIVGFLESGPYGLHTTFPVAKLGDLQGRKLRAAGPIHGKLVRSLGAVPVGNISAPQIAESISRGLLDGTLMSWASLRNFRIADVTSHHMADISMGSVSIFFAMNKKKYESLPSKAKAALDKYAGAWFTRVVAEVQDAEDAKAEKALAADGKHVVRHLDGAEQGRWEKALDDLKDEWDKPNQNSVNLYQEANAAIKAVRAGK